jgi:hypothetical protein
LATVSTAAPLSAPLAAVFSVPLALEVLLLPP